jgi:hypothetical protein
MKIKMKNFFLLIILIFITSCAEMVENIGCGTPYYTEQNIAKSLYNELSSFRVRMSYEQARKIFGCYYRRGDLIYSYNRLYDSGYLLMRNGEIISYREAK